jgi:LAO/AO transport system kinase
MAGLTAEPGAFIRRRPAPDAGRRRPPHARDHAVVRGAGYDVILVETTGVGQSEAVVVEMVDSSCSSF